MIVLWLDGLWISGFGTSLYKYYQGYVSMDDFLNYTEALSTTRVELILCFASCFH